MAKSDAYKYVPDNPPALLAYPPAPAPVNRPASAFNFSPESFADSSKAQILSNPKPLPINKFEKLRAEFRNRPMEDLKEHMEWLDNLHKELGSDTIVKAYFKWVRGQHRLARAPVTFPEDEIIRLLQDVNWKEGNGALKNFNSILWRTRHNSARNLVPLRLHLLSAWLLVDGQPMPPPEVDNDTCEAYNVDVLNPGFVLGMRYLPLDGNKNRELLFAPLGQSLRSHFYSLHQNNPT